MYNLRENFGLYKRQINGLFNGLTDNSDSLWTLQDVEKERIENILRKILDEINSKYNKKLHYLYTDKVTTDKNVTNDPNDIKYIIDFFVHDLSNQTTKRFMIVMIVNDTYKNVNIETLNLSNAIKLPEKQFMELPADKLILTDNNIGSRLGSSEYHIMGLNKSNLEFSILKNSTSKKVPSPPEFQHWILPEGIQTCQKDAMLNYPCRKQFKCWDIDGIHYTEDEYVNCKGLKNNNHKIPKVPYDNPTVNEMKTIDNDYYWLFDLSRGISGFPHGLSNGK